MKKFQLLITLGLALILGACSGDDGKVSEQGSVDDGEATSGYGAIDHGIDDKKIGFSLAGESIEEATGVPAKEKEQILEVFDVYIETLNEKDIEKYLETLSEKTYDIEEQRAFTTEQLEEYDIKREAESVTIVQYDESEAQVYAEINMTYKQLSTGLETNPSGRQVTVFTKEEGEWKVSSLHYLGDSE